MDQLDTSPRTVVAVAACLLLIPLCVRLVVRWVVYTLQMVFLCGGIALAYALVVLGPDNTIALLHAGVATAKTTWTLLRVLYVTNQQ